MAWVKDSIGWWNTDGGYYVFQNPENPSENASPYYSTTRDDQGLLQQTALPAQSGQTMQSVLTDVMSDPYAVQAGALERLVNSGFLNQLPDFDPNLVGRIVADSQAARDDEVWGGLQPEDLMLASVLAGPALGAYFGAGATGAGAAATETGAATIAGAASPSLAAGIGTGLGAGVMGAAPASGSILSGAAPAAVGGVGGAAGVAGAAGGASGASGASGLAEGAAAGGAASSILSNPALIGAGLGLGASLLGGNEPAGTTTSVEDIPEWLKPYATQGLTGLSNAYQASPGGVAPITTAGNQYLTDVIGGDYLNNNPYLDAMFDRSAGKVTAGVNSLFSQGGRYGSGAHQGVLAENLGNLATDIYGGNYARERANQQAAALGAGTYGNTLIDQPFRPAQNLLTGVNQIRGGTKTDPYFQNRFADALSGAVGGSILGRMFA